MGISLCPQRLPTQLSTSGVGKTAEGGPSIWAPGARVGDGHEDPGFCLAQH